jgi:hypothetical protein
MADIFCYTQTTDFAMHEHGVFRLDDATKALQEFDRTTSALTGDEECLPCIGFKNEVTKSFLEFARRSDQTYDVRFEYPGEVKVLFLQFRCWRTRSANSLQLTEVLDLTTRLYAGLIEQTPFPNS